MTDPNAAASAPKVIPAATVIIFRNCPNGGPPEILMVQRTKEMRFAGGAAVFPGGKVDPADHDLARRIAPGGADLIQVAARIAGVRETLEETGLAIAVTRQLSGSEVADARRFLLEQGALGPVLERFDWQLDLGQLVPFARWCPRRDDTFDARFYLANLGTGAVDIEVDATENTRLFWASARDALNMADSGDISVIFPTRCNLDRLALFSSFDDARAHAEAHPIETISASVYEVDGEKWLSIPEGLGYPITRRPLAGVVRGLPPRKD